MSDKQEGKEMGTQLTARSLARTYQLRAADLDIAALHVAALNDELQARVATLDHDELMVLRGIKDKLNAGLSDRLQEAANTVGGFVW